MKIALIGYGKMGKEIEKIALGRKHEIVLAIDEFNQSDFTIENLKKADVAIDFSIPSTAFTNILKCFEANVPVVCGTTGWLDKYNQVKEICEQQQKCFFYASNFSLGVNIFFALNKYLSKIMDDRTDYNVSVKEIHHIHKLDAPSGTAITLANDMIGSLKRKTKWELNNPTDSSTVNITAVREGEVPGTHIITWDSPVDSIEIAHKLKSRKSLAFGAVLAAEFIKGKRGVFSMQDMIRL